LKNLAKHIPPWHTQNGASLTIQEHGEMDVHYIFVYQCYWVMEGKNKVQCKKLAEHTGIGEATTDHVNIRRAAIPTT
jgi:hypothetical protein